MLNIIEKDSLKLISAHEVSDQQIKDAFEIMEMRMNILSKMQTFAQTYHHQGFQWDFSPMFITDVHPVQQHERRMGFK